jgi:hypothetical protein
MIFIYFLTALSVIQDIVESCGKFDLPKGVFTCPISLSDFAVRCDLERNNSAEKSLHRNFKNSNLSIFNQTICLQNIFFVNKRSTFWTGLFIDI